MKKIIRTTLMILFCLFAQQGMGMEHVDHYEDNHEELKTYGIYHNYGSIKQMQQSHAFGNGKLPMDVVKVILQYLPDEEKMIFGYTAKIYYQKITLPLLLNQIEVTRKKIIKLLEYTFYNNGGYEYNQEKIKNFSRFTKIICDIRDRSLSPELENKARLVILSNQREAVQFLGPFGTSLKKQRHYVQTPEYQAYKRLDAIYNPNPESCLGLMEFFSGINDSCCYWNDPCRNYDDLCCSKCCCNNIYFGPDGCFRPSRVSKTCYHMCGLSECPDIRYFFMSSVLSIVCCPCWLGACLFMHALENGAD